MKCPQCGNELPDGVEKCPECEATPEEALVEQEEADALVADEAADEESAAEPEPAPEPAAEPQTAIDLDELHRSKRRVFPEELKKASPMQLRAYATTAISSLVIFVISVPLWFDIIMALDYMVTESIQMGLAELMTKHELLRVLIAGIVALFGDQVTTVVQGVTEYTTEPFYFIAAVIATISVIPFLLGAYFAAESARMAAKQYGGEILLKVIGAVFFSVFAYIVMTSYGDYLNPGLRIILIAGLVLTILGPCIIYYLYRKSRATSKK